MTYVVGVGPRRCDTVPLFRYRKRRSGGMRPRQWRSLGEAMGHLEVTEGVAGQIVPGSTIFTFASDLAELDRFRLVAGECAYLGREGIEFYPQELLLFRYAGPGPAAGTVFLENIQVEKSKYRIPKGRVPIETMYLYPLAKGPAIGAFAHTYEGIIVPFPYEVADPHRPIPAERLRVESPLLLGYYERHAEVIRAQTKFSDKIRGEDAGEFYGLARTGPYSFAKLYVAFRDNSRWCAAVIGECTLPWGETKRFLFQNHAVSMCEAPSGRPISSAEAHYVCAVLNAPTVVAFIGASSDERSFKIRPPVFLPEFDATDSKHVALSDLSLRAHATPAAIAEIREEIEKIYLEMCSKRRKTTRLCP